MIDSAKHTKYNLCKGRRRQEGTVGAEQEDAVRDLLLLIKRNRIVKNYRIDKWKRFSKRMMFSPKEVSYLEHTPEKIREAVYSHINSNSNIPANIVEELEKMLSKSYLAGSTEITDALKTDMLFWYFAYGFSFSEYLCYRFHGKTREERLSFFSDRESVSLGYDMNDINDIMVFGDKINTYNRFRDYYGREAIALSSSSDYASFLEFTDRHKQFVKKDVYQACGRGVERIDLEQDQRPKKTIFDYLISEGKVILEEIVRQSEKTAAFNGSSVNTIRCITLKTKKDILVPYCFMKIGRKGAFVDNGGAGGILVGIDPRTGILCTDGVDENGIRYKSHPDSNVQFKGYQLPAWDEMICLCKKLAEKIPTVHMIGWDTAHTENGWIVIEGNALTEVIGPQSTWLRGIRKDVEAFYKMV